MLFVFVLVWCFSDLTENSVIFSPTWIFVDIGNSMPALAMVVSRCALLCHTEDPCALAHSCSIEILFWMALTGEGSGIDGISKRPNDLSGIGYHDHGLCNNHEPLLLCFQSRALSTFSVMQLSRLVSYPNKSRFCFIRS